MTFPVSINFILTTFLHWGLRTVAALARSVFIKTVLLEKKEEEKTLLRRTQIFRKIAPGLIWSKEFLANILFSNPWKDISEIEVKSS